MIARELEGCDEQNTEDRTRGDVGIVDAARGILDAVVFETTRRNHPNRKRNSAEMERDTWWVALDANPCEKFSILEVLECVSE